LLSAGIFTWNKNMSCTARPSLRIVVGPNSASSIGASAIFAATAEPGPASHALGGAHIGELAGIDAGVVHAPAGAFCRSASTRRASASFKFQ
jgi:hypothetical protein